MMVFNTLQHLLPSGSAWRIIVDKPLRGFFVGLANAIEHARDFTNAVYLDMFADTTRELAEFEEQFGLSSTHLEDPQRRTRVGARWRETGGQSPRYIQDSLQALGFYVFVHDWWELPVSGAPVARNPITLLASGTPQYFPVSGPAMVGQVSNYSITGARNIPPGWPLTNRYPEVPIVIPPDPTTFSSYLYIGGATFPSQAIIPGARREEFIQACLRICPTHLWLGMLIDFN